MGLIIGVLLLDRLLPDFSGTISEFEDFDAEADAQELHDALHGRGISQARSVDEEKITEILTNRTNEQRQTIQEEYKGMFGEDLYERVDQKIRRDDYRHVVKGLLLTPHKYDAKCLNQAMKGIGSSDDEVISEILVARSNEYIETLKEVYEEEYGEALEDAIKDNTRREFEHFMVALLQAGREEGIDAIDEDEAMEDAQELFDAGEDRWIFTDESVFTRIMARRSWLQIRIISNKYEEISEMTLEEAIDAEVDGDLRKAYKGVVRLANDPCRYFSRNIYKAMRGIGTDDDCLQRNIIFTAEWGLENIKEKYEEENGSAMADDVESESRGDYKDILLAIIK